MNIETSGFDELSKKLNSMRDAAEKLNGKNEVNLNELFNNKFLKENSSITSFDEFCELANIQSQSDFDSIPESELDKTVKSISSFSSWSEFLSSATEDFLYRTLGLN